MILVTDAIIHTKKKYIIVISGLDKDVVNNVCLEMAQTLKYTYLSFLDNPISDNQKNYNNIFYRVEYLLNIKPQGIIISLLSFPEKYNMIDVKLHINLSINQTYFDTIKNKFNYSNDLFIEYNNVLKSNKVNKYINTKLDPDLNQIKQQVFDTIITSVEKTYYGTNYDKVLQYRNDNQSNNDNSDNKKIDHDNNNKFNNNNNKFNNNKFNNNSNSNNFNNNKFNNNSNSNNFNNNKFNNNKFNNNSNSSNNNKFNNNKFNNNKFNNNKFNNNKFNNSSSNSNSSDNSDSENSKKFNNSSSNSSDNSDSENSKQFNNSSSNSNSSDNSDSIINNKRVKKTKKIKSNINTSDNSDIDDFDSDDLNAYSSNSEDFNTYNHDNYIPNDDSLSSISFNQDLGFDVDSYHFE